MAGRGQLLVRLSAAGTNYEDGYEREGRAACARRSPPAARALAPWRPAAPAPPASAPATAEDTD